MEADARRDTGRLALLWAIVTAANLFKPFHIDDGAHLLIARWIAGHPLHPMAGILNWDGLDQPISHTNQPHLFFYLMAGWAASFGWSEPAMHALEALFALAAILLFHRLARVLVPAAAVWTTALLALSPAFVVEQNLMVDVPLLALWLGCFVPLLLGGESEHQHRRYALAASACAGALLVKYSSLVLLPILAASLLVERRGRQTWVLVIPLAALAGWSGFNWFDYGGVHLLGRTGGPSDRDDALAFLIAWIVTLGGITPLGVVAALRWRGAGRGVERVTFAALALGFVGLAIAVLAGGLREPLADRLLRLAFLLNGTALFASLLPPLDETIRAARAHFRRPIVEAPQLLLLLWIGGTTLFYVLWAPFVAARHLLLILPALLLLVLGRGPAPSRAAQLFALAATILVSAGLARSDWRYAVFQRAEAARFARELAGSGRTWTIGHWGWQYYATRAGMTEVDLDQPGWRTGDWLVSTDAGEPREFPFGPRLIAVRRDVEPRSPFDLLCTSRNMRFYRANAERGPWSLEPDCTSHLDLFRVGPPMR